MITGIAWIKGFRELFSESENQPKPQLPEVMLTLFLWFNLLVLTGLGSSSKLTVYDLSVLVASGILALTSAAGIAVLLSWLKKELGLLVFLSYALLVMLPALVISPLSSNRIILLDLFFVLLVTTPALLSLWSWRFQALAGLLALFAVCVLWFPTGIWNAAHSIVLVALSCLFSGLVVLLRSRDTVQETRQIERNSLRMFFDAAQTKLPGQVWNILLLQAGLVVVLIFVDITVAGDFPHHVMFTKVYALLIVIFGGLLVKVSPPHFLSRVVALITVLVGFVLSTARVGYFDLQLLVAAVPIVYLAFLVTVLFWTIEFQIIVVWALVFNDLFLKFVRSLGNRQGDWIETFGLMLQHYRGELVLLCMGTVASVLVARSLRYYRIRNLSSFVEMQGDFEESKSMESSSSDQEHSWEKLSCLAREAVEPESRQQLIFGMFISGMLSSIVSSRLVLLLGVAFWNLAFAGWIGFFVLWAALIYLDREKVSSPYVWVMGVVTELAVFLWPCALLFVTPSSGYLWLFWPAGVLLGIGLVPWRARELIPLMLVAILTGIEMINQLDLGIVGAVVFVTSGIVALLFSVQRSRRLKEKYFLLSLSNELRKCSKGEEVLRVLADYLINLFNVNSALVSRSPDHLELIRDGRAFSLLPGTWPIRGLGNQRREIVGSEQGISLFAVNWLAGINSVFDRRFGLFHASNGLLIEIEVTPSVLPDKNQNGDLQLDVAAGNGSQRYVIFSGFRFPVFEILMANELDVARAMGDVARLRLECCLEEQCRRETAIGYESRLQEREQDLGALVHDINNTVQDLTLLCDTILEDILGVGSSDQVSEGSEQESELRHQIKRIAVIARSVATVVSDAKRRRELEKMDDLSPRELVEVTGVIRDVVSFAIIRAARKRIFVEQPELSNDEIWVRVSVQEHLETILRNLLNNAITYSDPGTTVRLELRYDNDWVWIDSIDNGPGLTEEDRKSIFVSGYRGKTANRVPGGLGMGLAESRRVAEAAGGRVDVFSAGEGLGSIFTVKLPRVANPVKTKPGEIWALVVDDQPALTEFYSRLAKALQLVPEVASSVPEALDVLERRGQPSLVITDVHLGERSGLELVSHLRKHFGGELPILVVSGLNDDDIVQKARSAGATDFVAKPIGRRALFARIQSLLPGF